MNIKNIFILCSIGLCVSNSTLAMFDDGYYCSDTMDYNSRTQKYLLHGAARDGNIFRVQQLIANNANVNQPDNAGNTPLHMAAENGHEVVVQILLNHHASVNQPDSSRIGSNNLTPLHLAALRGHEGVVQILLSNHADVNQTDGTGYTPLHWAAHMNRGVIAQILLNHKANVNKPDNYGKTPLHFASFRCHKDVIKILLYHNADVNQTDNYDMTSLYTAGSEAVFELLFCYVDDPQTLNPQLILRAELIKQKKARTRREIQTFLLATHPRLGERSPAYVLSHYLFRFICELIQLR